MPHPHQNSDHPSTKGWALAENPLPSEIHRFKAFNSTPVQTFYQLYCVAGAMLGSEYTEINKTPLFASRIPLSE